MKTVVLGLDGACWPLLEPWLAEGTLPHLAALRDMAAWGALRSQLPPVTSPNWRCYATGRNPGRLGVFWWEIVDRAQRTIRHPLASDFHTRPFWEELAAEGKQVGVLNFPTGYPPPAFFGGWFTAGGPGAKETGFAYPPAWANTLGTTYGYRVHPPSLLRSAADATAHLDELLHLLQTRFDVAFDLLDEGVDFLHVTLFYINVLHHFCYQDTPTRTAWQLIDENLGRLHTWTQAHDANLLLMSDHGCGPVDTVFYINTWLAERGYLTLRRHASTGLHRWGLHRQRMIRLARRIGMAAVLRRMVPPRLMQALPDDSGTFEKAAKGQRIDWERSVAMASGQGLIYLLIPPDDPGYEPVREEIAEALRALRHPETNRPLVHAIHRREDVYAGPFLDEAPDLVFEQAPGVHTRGGIGSPVLFDQPQQWAAENVPNGLFLATGPSFAPVGAHPDTRIIDLAPTLLHVMGHAVPEDMDGQVQQVLLAPTSEAAQRPVAFRPVLPSAPPSFAPDEEAALTARLRDLGYLDGP